MIAAPLHLFVHTITIERKTVTRDTGGAPIETWATHLANIQARININGGNEAEAGGDTQTNTQATIYTSGGQDILAKDRVIYAATEYEILAVSDYDKLGIMLELTCEITRP